jgi:hemoglobin
MKDIETYEDCVALVEAFYRRGRQDALIGPVFESRIAGRWDEHLETMTSFWVTVLFGVPRYAGRPLDRHAGLPIGAAHFARWLAIWHDEVDRRFAGERAELAKRAAMKMSLRMGAAANLHFA